MLLLVMLALAAFAGAMLFLSTGVASAAPVHLALAGGAMPLIAGAMLHFMPVLTRSAAPGRTVRALPWLMLLAGTLAVSTFLFPLPTGVRSAAATLCMAGAASLAGWSVRLSRRTLGAPHPGVYWYMAALGCLLLGLSMVLLMQAWPEHYAALRRFHLHLNTLGFIGITAVGTLQVLLPTAVGRPDPQAAQRLRSDVKWVVAGTLLIASGAAWQPWLVWPGLLLWLFPLLRLAAAWWALHRQQWNETATAVAGTLPGLFIVLLLGAGHASGLVPTTRASVAFVMAFLLPLVTGAASYLLPLWVRPGLQTPWHAQVRLGLGRHALARLLLFFAAGVITTWSGSIWGWVAALAALVLFAARLRLLAKAA